MRDKVTLSSKRAIGLVNPWLLLLLCFVFCSGAGPVMIQAAENDYQYDLYLGQMITLPQHEEGTVVSDNEKVVRIQDEFIVAAGAGDAVISVKTADGTKQICKVHVKENEKLKAEIDNWKNRGKKYKENIQNLKIKCSNLEQENNRVKKENGRLIRENEKTKQGKDTAVKEYNDRIIALSVENSKLKEKIRGKYKPKKNIVLSKTSGVSNPKVLCVTKNPADVLIKGYNIYFLTDLEELNKKIYTETVFDQIWYIRSGLTHADLIKVAEKYANQKILQARDWKALQKKLQGGDRL